MNENQNGVKVKIDDRVQRADGAGCKGIVTSIRTDVVSPTGDKRDRGVTIGVQWDNGTYSYFDPEGLTVVKG